MQLMFFLLRFLVNSPNTVPIVIRDNKNRTKLSIQSNNNEQSKIEKGNYDVVIDDDVVLKGFPFKSGAVYTINVYEDSKGLYVSVNNTTLIIVSSHRM